MKKKKDNDEICREVHQVIKDDTLMQLDTDGQEIQLLGRLAVLAYMRDMKTLLLLIARLISLVSAACGETDCSLLGSTP